MAELKPNRPKRLVPIDCSIDIDLIEKTKRGGSKMVTFAIRN
jgi:hypothetical protein